MCKCGVSVLGGADLRPDRQSQSQLKRVHGTAHGGMCVGAHAAHLTHAATHLPAFTRAFLWQPATCRAARATLLKLLQLAPLSHHRHGTVLIYGSIHSSSQCSEFRIPVRLSARCVGVGGFVDHQHTVMRPLQRQLQRL